VLYASVPPMAPLSRPQSDKVELIKKAIALRLKGDFEHAIDVIHLAEALNEEMIQNPRFPWLVRFNLGITLWNLGKYQEAEQLLPDLRELAVASGNELDLLRVLWLEGRLAAGMGRRKQAIASLEQVHGYFAGDQIAFDAALASVEIAVLYLEEGRTAEVKRLAEEMYWVFNAQEVTEEVLTGLRLFFEAARKEKATPELAQRIADFLHRACHQPYLRFEDFASEGVKA
jgi:tetratricopeptide (TPR) repeat protein